MRFSSGLIIAFLAIAHGLNRHPLPVRQLATQVSIPIPYVIRLLAKTYLIMVRLDED